MGYDLLNSFKKLKKRYLVVDYNPETIEKLVQEGIECRYGDVDDEEFLSELNLAKTKMIVSTIPEFEPNLLLINQIRKINKKAIIIVVSHNIREANLLYELGATYVVMPHFLGGSHASMMINKHRLNLNEFEKERKKHIEYLKNKRVLGYEYPKTEK